MCTRLHLELLTQSKKVPFFLYIFPLFFRARSNWISYEQKARSPVIDATYVYIYKDTAS